MNKYDKALLSGTVLRGKKNSYRIDRVLGQGTFGITYLAYTTVTVEGDLGKLQGEMQVAVKESFMSDINGREGSSVTTGGSGELFDRYRHKFAREASNLAKLKHRGIVKVIETFEANGTSYYAMEYCGGGSLDALIAKRGGLPEGEALRYFGQIAEALSYMHSQRMLHLDLKPGNVMLRTSGEAVLIDFGLSKQFNDKGEPESSTTIGGGTPGYAPLEQANYREDSGKLPVTMDIYALGGTLYKMLTGKRPPVASDVLIEFPEQPLRDHKVSNNVITAMRRAMESKPHDRYQSVAAFAAALDCASEATEAADREEEPEVVLVDDGRQSVAESQPHTPAAEPAHAHQEQQQNEYPEPEPEQPRRKWLPWVVGVAVAAIAFVAVMLLQPKPQPAIEVSEDLITAVTQSDTVSADEQPVQQVAQQPQKPEPQRPVRQEAVEQPQPTRPESQQTQQQPQRPQHNLPEVAMVYDPPQSLNVAEGFAQSDTVTFSASDDTLTDENNTIESILAQPDVTGLSAGYTLEHWGNPSSPVEGTVVIRVRVNARGKVIEARYSSGSGSAASNMDVRRNCEQASMQSQFKVPVNTVSEAVGYITWKFFDNI